MSIESTEKPGEMSYVIFTDILTPFVAIDVMFSNGYPVAGYIPTSSPPPIMFAGHNGEVRVTMEGEETHQAKVLTSVPIPWATAGMKGPYATVAMAERIIQKRYLKKADNGGRLKKFLRALIPHVEVSLVTFTLPEKKGDRPILHKDVMYARKGDRYDGAIWIRGIHFLGAVLLASTLGAPMGWRIEDGDFDTQ